MSETLPTLFDDQIERQYGRKTGEQLRDEGTSIVAGNESLHGEWMDAAHRALRELAASGSEFNADQLREKIGDPVRPNAMGAVFLQAVRSKLIEEVGYRKMTRPIGHARRTFVYRGRR